MFFTNFPCLQCLNTVASLLFERRTERQSMDYRKSEQEVAVNSGLIMLVIICSNVAFSIHKHTYLVHNTGIYVEGQFASVR